MPKQSTTTKPKSTSLSLTSVSSLNKPRRATPVSQTGKGFTPRRQSQQVTEDALSADYRKWVMARKYTGKDMFYAIALTAAVTFALMLLKVNLG